VEGQCVCHRRTLASSTWGSTRMAAMEMPTFYSLVLKTVRLLPLLLVTIGMRNVSWGTKGQVETRDVPLCCLTEFGT